MIKDEIDQFIYDKNLADAEQAIDLAVQHIPPSSVHPEFNVKYDLCLNYLRASTRLLNLRNKTL